ncbi:alpha/beta hydrolase [Spongiactinospora gelatinilytica]|uniref:Alpha/beta hydrolase n=1 Tax=Spongiactinospora gelatinilytica TaxID=2666298 RepID=A0A2W2FDC3_9ACTN|nr:alpha/beta hydrolase [Spongiactinospora gelatinilytica]PZG23420.1 alpha/beta hydrolase [Spongiactinospora gelatinilytica]
MRKTGPLLAAAMAALVGLTAFTPAQAAEPDAATIEWAACASPRERYECGTLTVPVDWKNPAGPTVDLFLSRQRATDPAARIGSLLVNPGGPGLSGATFATFDFFSPEVRRRFDIVGFDVRGTADSNRVLCSADLIAQYPDTFIENQAELDHWRDFSSRARADCKSRTGPVFEHLDSVSVARDMDAVRAALGEEKVTYYGISYGTMIGQAYAEQFPHRIRAMALDSVVDHSAGGERYFRDTAAHVQDVFDAFVKWCAGETRCALHGKDVRAIWARLKDRAERGELGGMSKAQVLRIIFNGSYAPAWYSAAEQIARLDTSAPPAPLRAPGDIHFPWQLICADFDMRIRDHREYAWQLRRAKAVAPDMEFNPSTLTVNSWCLSEPRPIPYPQHRLRVRGAPPILVVNSRHDPITGRAWAVSVARQIGRAARLLTYEGVGHGVYDRSDCTISTIDRYLIALKPPAYRASCPAVPLEPSTQVREPQDFLRRDLTDRPTPRH